jgi:hypothetical protein
MATVSQGINFATKICKAPDQSRFAPLLLLTQGLSKILSRAQVVINNTTKPHNFKILKR